MQQQLPARDNDSLEKSNLLNGKFSWKNFHLNVFTLSKLFFEISHTTPHEKASLLSRKFYSLSEVTIPFIRAELDKFEARLGDLRDFFQIITDLNAPDTCREAAVLFRNDSEVRRVANNYIAAIQHENASNLAKKIAKPTSDNLIMALLVDADGAAALACNLENLFATIISLRPAAESEVSWREFIENKRRDLELDKAKTGGPNTPAC